MSNQLTDKDLLTDKALKRLQELQRDVNRHHVKVLDELERYASSDAAQPSRQDDDLRIASRYTKAEIKDAVAAERIFRLVTLDDWLEIARDFYQDSTGTKRRPKLLEDEFVTFLRLNDKHGSGEVVRPEQFLNAVWMLGKDPQVDHATFETLPWWGTDDNPHDGACWQKYLSKARDAFKVYWPPIEYEESWQAAAAVLDVEEPHDEPVLVPSPNCRPRCHLPKSQFAIYDFAASLSAKNGGECWLSRETCAKWAHMHPQTVRTSIDWLIAHGWLIEVKAPRRGVGGQGQYRVVSHADWISAKGSASCVQIAAD
jgi:hypothetical protein